MPSSIPGYEYDIFISYRQKDNRSRSDGEGHEKDGWVTEFVANLKKELEVTVKEEISVYFDENPYDGITDGHEVNDSLSAKLKCLIFIPIISHSYCDTKSYAWNNEFLYFKQLAAADQFGLKVRLENGNVASRIVPVRIHEPDVRDSLLLVKEIGGVLRSIDFIFRTPGVNRPLQANEDHPQDNRNKTYYRDQINKVANLIKDIIQSLKTPGIKGAGVYPREGKISELVSYATRGKRTLALTVSVVLLVFVYFLFQGNFDSISAPGPVRTTIAVIPFKVFGGEEESRYFAEGVSEDIRLNISLFPELKVKSRTSVERYRDNPKSIPEIAKELNVLYILEGSAQKVGNNIRVTVNLIDTRADVNLWSEKFEKKFENVFEIQNQISEAIARSLKATLTRDISERISRTPTKNFEVYDLFLRARQASRMYSHSHDPADLDLSINLFQQSIRKEPRFALGYAWLAGVKMIRSRAQLSEKAVMDSVLWLATRALEIDSTVVEASFALSQLYHLENDDVNALRYTYKSLEHERIDSVSVVDLVMRLGSIYSRIGDIDRALALFDEILKLNPNDGEVLRRKFLALAAGHRVEQLKELTKQIRTDDHFMDLVRTHIALEGRQYPELERIYQRQDFFSNGQMDSFDQYALVYATALRKNGKKEEALKLARSLEESFAGYNYFNVQLQIFYGRIDEGLNALETEEVGWYNLNLCRINPVFEKVSKDPRFKNFLERNSDRLIDQRDRVHQLEDEGYLQRPEEFLGKTIPERVMSI